jgi:threonine dehydratase
LNIPAHIVMPSISTKSKIAGTRAYNARVIFSGSTEPERVAVVEGVIKETGAILVPPYDHPDIILGQGTVGLELEDQVKDLIEDCENKTSAKCDSPLNAVITPLGGGGLLAGTAVYFSNKPSTYVFGAEPSFEGGDDGRRGLACGSRISTVSSLTIADGLRTPVGEVNWTVISDQRKVRGIFSVTEEQIKEAMKLIFERLKVVVEPSAAVPLAVILFDEEFRQIAEKEGGGKGWTVGVVLSGGNTTVEAISRLYREN